MRRDPFEDEEHAMNWREKEWDEPGPDFGKPVYFNTSTGEIEVGDLDE